ALVSDCTRPAAPCLTITSSARGATSDQAYPAASPSRALPATIASDTPIAARLTSNGRAGPASPGRAAPGGSGCSGIVGSSVPDPGAAAHRRAPPQRPQKLATVGGVTDGDSCRRPGSQQRTQPHW